MTIGALLGLLALGQAVGVGVGPTMPAARSASGVVPVWAVCGDGMVNGADACDDGGVIAGDGCSATCTVEDHWSCDGASPTVCTQYPLADCATDPGGHPTPLFDFAPCKARSGYTALPTTLTVNSTALTLIACYNANDAGATTWTPCGSASGSLTNTEGGGNVTLDDPTPFLAYDNGAVKFAGGDYYTAGTSTPGDIGLDSGNPIDFVMETVWYHDQSATIIWSKRNGISATIGYSLTSSATAVNLVIGDGTDFVSASCGSTPPVGWQHHLAYVDRSAGAAGVAHYMNATACTAGNITNLATETLSTAQKFTIGARSDGVSSTSTALATVRIWRCPVGTPACLDNSDLAEEARIAKERAATVMGILPTATGEDAPTVMTRAQQAWQRVKDSGGTSRIFPVGNHWMTVDRNNTLVGYRGRDTTGGNSLLYSEDVSNWTELVLADTQTLNQPDPIYDYADTFDCTTSDGTNAVHGFSQAFSGSASPMFITAIVKPGDETWTYLEVSTTSCYFDVSNCTVGTCSGAAASFADSFGGGWCRIGMRYTHNGGITAKIAPADSDLDNVTTGTGSTTQCYGAMQAGVGDFPLAYVRTIGSTVAFADDQLSFSSASNHGSSGSVAQRLYTPLHGATSCGPGAYTFSVSTAAGVDANEGYIAGTSCAISNLGIKTTVVQWNIVSSTLPPSAAYNVATSYAANDVELYYNGASIGTDVSAAVPVGTPSVFITGGGGSAAGSLSVMVGRQRHYSQQDITQ